jgi:hypothetical protein
MPWFDFNLMVAPSAVLEPQGDERSGDSIASMRDSSKAAPQLICLRCFDKDTRALSMRQPAARP